MTVSSIGNGIYLGLSTDTKPTTGVVTGAIFLETNTGLVFYYSGSVWNAGASGSGGGGSSSLAFANSYTFTVYVESGTVKARNNKTGSVAYTNANLDPVITSILGSADPSFEIQSGTYNLSSGFGGWSVVTNTTAKLQRDTLIKVPQNYAGYVWNYGTSVKYTTIEGGRYDEQGSTPGFNWTCFKFSPASPNGSFTNTIRAVSYTHLTLPTSD